MFCRVLTDDQIARLHEASLAILHETGVHVPHADVLERFADAGARVDRDAQRVRIPPELVMRCLGRAGREFTLHGRDVSRTARFGQGRRNYNSIAGEAFWVDEPGGPRRRAVLSDVATAGRFLQAGAEAVKGEGAGPVVPAIKRLVELGIPVMGHLGLTPQSVHKLGGYRLQARKTGGQERLLADARALADAGCFSIVLEKVPAEVAKRVTAELPIPTIGIGAGPDCDGQVLVLHDMLGLFDTPPLKFVKQYAQLAGEVRKAVTAYAEDVRAGRFPDQDHSFHLEK